MQSQVFSPLTLKSASFEPPNDMTDLVQGYDADGITPIPYWHQLYPAFGALNISSRDMLRFVQILLNDGSFLSNELLPPSVVRRMSKPSTSLAAKAGLAYGYGKGLYHFQHNGHTFFGHGGDADGYLAFMAFSNALNRGYYLVINSYQPATLKTLRNIIQDFIARDINPTRPAIIKLDESDTKLLLGEYKEVTSRFVSKAPPKRLKISIDATGKYVTRIGDGAAKQLLPVTQRFFRRPWQSAATIALVRFDGKIYLQGDFGNFVKLSP